MTVVYGTKQVRWDGGDLEPLRKLVGADRVVPGPPWDDGAHVYVGSCHWAPVAPGDKVVVTSAGHVAVVRAL